MRADFVLLQQENEREAQATEVTGDKVPRSIGPMPLLIAHL
jgi:hypothetical protein